MDKNPYDSLLDISEEISSLHQVDALMDRIMDIAMEVLAAERGFILLKEKPQDTDFEAVSARNINQETISSIHSHSSSVVAEVFKNGKPILTFDAQKDDRFSSSQSIIRQQIRSIVCTPLLIDQSVVGVIYADCQQSADRFTEDSLHFLQAFSRLSAQALKNIQYFDKIRSENDRLKKQLSLENIFPEIIGKSVQIREILEIIDQVADSRATVLIEGESGTGKELVARALHFHSQRQDKIFVPVFCGGLSESLLESELFGHKKGSFTGAIENRAGLFEEAEGGTIFLDEIGDININIQTKLLRAIQEGEIKRVGENKIRKVNARLVAATNKDLLKEVKENRFREDLYYRLNVIDIKMPPLRERGDDTIILAEKFLNKFARENGKVIDGFSSETQKLLKSYHWPGNIRELENAVERAVILCRNSVIQPSLFNLNRMRSSNLTGKTLKDAEKALILETLEMTDNHRTKTAELLGVSRRWLQYRLKEWGIEKGDS